MPAPMSDALPIAGDPGHGWWPYLVPLFSFLALAEVAGRIPEPAPDWLDGVLLAARVLVPGALFVRFWRGGAYPELRHRIGLGHGLADLAVGVAGAALWMAPFVALQLGPGLEVLPAFIRPDPADGFDPGLLGPELVALTLALRVTGYAVVIPFAEEVFVRSWLARYADVFDRDLDFRSVPIARFSRRSLLVVTLFFTLSHVPWEWPVAMLWILGTQLWFYFRRQLGALVLVHAASNLSIFVAVLLLDGRLRGADGAPIGLFYFL